jgi:surface antigen
VSPARIFCIALGLSAFVPAAQAATGNLGFLTDTPYAFMKDEDRARFHAALEATLNDAADGETREWSSPGGGSSGKLTVVRTLEDPARRCREMHVANRAGGRAEANNIVFCRGEDGKWLLRPGS